MHSETVGNVVVNGQNRLLITVIYIYNSEQTNCTHFSSVSLDLFKFFAFKDFDILCGRIFYNKISNSVENSYCHNISVMLMCVEW